MEELKRYFMDRRLGRGTIRACSTADGSISVDLDFRTLDTGLHHVQLRASPECIGSLTEMGNDLFYKLSRMAISQVQFCLQDKTIFCDHLELDCLGRPWNGDLTEVPYGGSTLGCVAPTKPRAVKRPRRLALTILGYRTR